MLVLALAFANLDGEFKLNSIGNAQVSSFTYLHGWPDTCLHRSKLYRVGAGGMDAWAMNALPREDRSLISRNRERLTTLEGRLKDGNVAFASRWPFRGEAVTGFSLASLFQNLLVALVLIGGTVIAMEQRIRRIQLPRCFTLKGCLAVTAAIASVFYLFGAQTSSWAAGLMNAATVMMLLLGVCLTWLAAFDVLEWLLRRSARYFSSRGISRT